MFGVPWNGPDIIFGFFLKTHDTKILIHFGHAELVGRIDPGLQEGNGQISLFLSVVSESEDIIHLINMIH